MDQITGRMLNNNMEFYKLAGIGDIGELVVHMMTAPATTSGVRRTRRASGYFSGRAHFQCRRQCHRRWQRCRRAITRSNCRMNAFIRPSRSLWKEGLLNGSL